MIKHITILAFLMLGNFSLAQNRSAIDSLFQVKRFLIEIKQTVNKKQTVKEKTAQLTRIIRLASTQKAVFNRNSVAVVKNQQELTQLKTALNLILQSVILYKEDLNQKGTSPSESLYLNKNIPIMIDKINYYCKAAEIEWQHNTK